jgi:hypothetical protein
VAGAAEGSVVVSEVAASEVAASAAVKTDPYNV